MVIALVRLLVRPLVRPSLNISETAHYISLKLCMKLKDNKVKCELGDAMSGLRFSI